MKVLRKITENEQLNVNLGHNLFDNFVGVSNRKKRSEISGLIVSTRGNILLTHWVEAFTSNFTNVEVRLG